MALDHIQAQSGVAPSSHSSGPSNGLHPASFLAGQKLSDLARPDLSHTDLTNAQDGGAVTPMPKRAANTQTPGASQAAPAIPSATPSDPALRARCEELATWGAAINHGGLVLAVATGVMLFYVGFFGHPLEAVLGIPVVFLCLLLHRVGAQLELLGGLLDPRAKRVEAAQYTWARLRPGFLAGDEPPVDPKRGFSQRVNRQRDRKKQGARAA
ncbi:MAG: hypothetical protein MRY63_08970 [Neomegalonema sp.]|nr:hypothetical protein [Neomegalonema sp.]